MIVTALFTGVLTIPAYYCIHYVSDIEEKGAQVNQAEIDEADLPVGAAQGKKQSV